MAYLHFFCLVVLINIQGSHLLPNDRPWHWEKVYDDTPQEVAAAILRKDISHQIPVKKEMDISKAELQVMAKKDSGSPMCSSKFPYAFGGGKGCCSTFQDCTGNNLMSTSYCCGKGSKKCSGSSCTNARVAYWTAAQVQEEFKELMPFGPAPTETVNGGYYWRFRSKLSAEEKAKCLTNMNMYRRKHVDTPDVVWDEDLAKGAEDWAQHLMWKQWITESNDVSHSAQKQRWLQGENIFTHLYDEYGGYQDDEYDDGGVTCVDAQKAWYGEIANWDFENSKPKGKEEAHHFTAMVWKGITKYGIGIATGFSHWNWDDPGSYEYYTTSIIVARFATNPNIPGEEKNNVMPPK